MICSRWKYRTAARRYPNEKVCTITLARLGVQHDGMGISRRHALLEFFYQCASFDELGPVPWPMSKSMPHSQSVSKPQSMSESKSVPESMSGTRSVPESVPESVSGTRPVSESVPGLLARSELVVVLVLGQLWLHVPLQLPLRWHALQQLLDSVISVNSNQDTTRGHPAVRITSGSAVDLTEALPPLPAVKHHLSR